MSPENLEIEIGLQLKGKSFGRYGYQIEPEHKIEELNIFCRGHLLLRF